MCSFFWSTSTPLVRMLLDSLRLLPRIDVLLSTFGKIECPTLLRFPVSLDSGVLGCRLQ